MAKKEIAIDTLVKKGLLTQEQVQIRWRFGHAGDGESPLVLQVILDHGADGPALACFQPLGSRHRGRDEHDPQRSPHPPPGQQPSQAAAASQEQKEGQPQEKGRAWRPWHQLCHALPA